MSWTFGIITAGNEVERLNKVLKSIIWECCGRTQYEIIVVGGDIDDIDFGVGDGEIEHIAFDESIKPAWITKKKNLLAQNAKHDNLVIMHDYVALQKGWLEGFNKFGDDWFSCTNQILNKDGTDFRSWAAVFQDAYREPIDDQKPPTHLGLGRKISPNIKSWGRWQYYSGAYFVVKKQVLLDIPFDQSLCHFGGEDITWSRALYQKYGNHVFNWNPYSQVKFLKMKDIASWELLPEIDFDYHE